MRKTFALLLAVVLLLITVACANGNTEPTNNSTTATSTTKPQTSTTSTTTSNSTSATTEFVEPKDYAVVMEVSINPKFKLYLDKNYCVIAIEPLNDDAKAISIRFYGDESFETIVEALISKGKEEGYVKRNEPVNIQIFYMNKKSVNVDEMNSRMKALATDMSEKYNAIVKFKVPSDVSTTSKAPTTRTTTTTKKVTTSTTKKTTTTTTKESASAEEYANAIDISCIGIGGQWSETSLICHATYLVVENISNSCEVASVSFDSAIYKGKLYPIYTSSKEEILNKAFKFWSLPFGEPAEELLTSYRPLQVITVAIPPVLTPDGDYYYVQPQDCNFTVNCTVIFKDGTSLKGKYDFCDLSTYQGGYSFSPEQLQ